MRKIHPSAAWNKLNPILYVICKVKCNHRETFPLPQPALLKVPLFLSHTVSSIHFIFPSIIVFSDKPHVLNISLFLSVTSFYSHHLGNYAPPSWSFLLFRCYFLSWHCVLSLSCSLSVLHVVAHTHTNTHINNPSVTLLKLRQENVISKIYKKSHLRRIFTAHYFAWKNNKIKTLTHLRAWS